MPSSKLVLLAGIEPASPPSEGGILSIERQEGKLILSFCGHKSNSAVAEFARDGSLVVGLSLQETRRQCVLFGSTKYKKAHQSAFLYFVLPVGIEPTFIAPQAIVLSIERRERAKDDMKARFHFS